MGISGTICRKCTVASAGCRKRRRDVNFLGSLLRRRPAEGHFFWSAAYRLTAGRLSAPSLALDRYAIMNQYGGTNQLTGGGLTISNTAYHLWNGRLETTYSGVGVQAWISQDHGVHKINGVLSVTGDYELWGGTVDASGFYLRGILTARDYYDAGSFRVSGLTDLGGTIYARMTNINLSAVRLSTNAVIDFQDNLNGIGAVTCANSSMIAWTPGQTLVISNWHGGTNHISFGTGPSGLTPIQVGQVWFVNPVGMPAGSYPAQILSNGELVPVSRPTLQMAWSGSALVLTWPDNYRLLSATNLTGPYTAVANASSPWTNPFAKPKEFFMLQGL